MFMTVLKTERIKLRHSPVWIAFLALPLLPAFFGTLNYLNNLEVLQKGWYSLWTQHTLFSCYFFLPLVIGVYCAYLWRMEHSGYNWNQTLTVPVRRVTLVLAKLSMAMGMSALMLGWTFALYILGGLMAHCPGGLPAELPVWFLRGLLGTAALCAVQLFLGLVFRSFAVPVGLAMIGGIGGLMMSSKGYGLLCPYSLLSMGMNANGKDEAFSMGAFLLSGLIFTALFTAASALYMKRRGG